LEENMSDQNFGGVLSRDELKARLKEDLVISPLLEESQIGEGAVDISLGTRFITNRRSQTTDIDPSQLDDQQIRQLQQSLAIPFAGKFVLHPNNLVLGCTFEFIALPSNISAFVLSRSAYGRTGLLIATATYVHPGWQGCLTLELANLGEFPISLKPLSKVGQLVLMHATKLKAAAKFKSIPVGPSYSSLSSDPRWEKISQLEKP
jgi:dCTP deaminase